MNEDKEGNPLNYEPNWKNEDTDALVRALLTLQTEEEAYQVLNDLCTINEIQAMAQRIQIAQLLADKEVYSEIAGETGASTATISRVNRCLNYGAGGYQLLFSRMKEKD